jgi:glycosyltransferase involved in cell wall biosynthesis
VAAGGIGWQRSGAASGKSGSVIRVVAPTVSVVVPARDAEAHLPRTLAALAAQRTAPKEVIVVDDGSTDATGRIARESVVVKRVLRCEGVGPGAARNAAAAVATGDVLAFTDADCEPDSGWLEAGLAAMADADLVQGAVVPAPGAPAGPWDHTITVTVAHGLFETANVLIRRELFEQLGGFEPWLSPRDGKELGEDVWLGWRARRAGARVAFAADAVVQHAVLPRSAAEFVAERARLRFFPAMAARIPELRDAFLHRRYFLSPRTLEFDAALAAVSLARRHPVALLLAAPYVRRLAQSPPQQAAVLLAADAVGCAALVVGSVRSRSVVL